MELWSEFLNNQHRLIDKWKHYFLAYDRHFARFKGQDVTVVEIGSGNGGSAQMWKRYFGPNARIYSLDINPDCKNFSVDQIEVFIGDQSDTKFLQDVISKIGTPDIIIDDGSHIMNHIRTTFDCLYDQLAKNGVYLVEDLHTAYWEEYGGGLNHPESFIEYAKTLIDRLNTPYIRNKIDISNFYKSTISIHFYDSIIVFEKGRNTAKKSLRIGS